MDAADDVLIAAYRRGDIEAFGRLYDRHDRRLHGFVLAFGGRREEAEDVVQRTWLRVIEALPRYRARGRFRPWLFQIAHRQWLDHVRNAWERKRVNLGDSAPEDFEGLPVAWEALAAAETPASAAVAAEERNRLYAAIEALPDLLRQTILLRIDGELSFREVAAAMRCPLGTALWRAHEAERRLKEAIGNDG